MKETALRPAGCVCPWGQVHMEMPWQKLGTAADCPVHNSPGEQAEPFKGIGRNVKNGRRW